jgi:copper homeostasis protein
VRSDPAAPLALEVIATSLADAVAAEQGGASRIELVAALDRGGLTPPVDLVDAVLARVRIPVRVMVRETEPHEVPDPVVRARLVEAARAIGQRDVGLVFGALTGGGIDEPLLGAIAEAGRRPITFHRAFESVTDPVGALRTLRRYTVDRVLCDGGPGDWTARAARLADWTRQAAPAVQMLAGGGITEEALVALSAEPALREVHVGRLVRDPATAEGGVSARRVAALVARLRLLRAGSAGE